MFLTKFAILFVRHYDLQISIKRTTMEIRGITFPFCVILGSDWQAINHCNMVYMLHVYVLYAFYIGCICFMMSIYDTGINKSIKHAICANVQWS